MTSLLEMAAGFLRADEREVVLGDLAESGADVWSGLRSVLGFVVRQQLELWRSWRPWVASGVSLPGSLLLLGVSFALSEDARNLRRSGSIPWTILCEVLLMLAWAWTSGFMVGSLSRRTRWISTALCAIPCLSCVLRFQDTSLSRFCVLLFLAPGVEGAIQGIRRVRLQLRNAVVLATAITGLMLVWSGMSAWNWPLLLPSWFLVAMGERSEGSGKGMVTSWQHWDKSQQGS
jgi:hypothetical protein